MWFRSYLSDCKQIVSINNQSFDLLPVLSGVPQGSVLRPLLFIIYINDLTATIKYSLPFIFADNTKCLSKVKSLTDSTLLQKDLNSISSWGIKWSMTFNELKCVHLHISSNPDSTQQYFYFINNTRISSANSHRDLGVIMSNDLSWTEHYHRITSCA